VVTDRQVRRLLMLVNRESTPATAAAKAGMDETTARKYRRLGSCCVRGRALGALGPGHRPCDARC